MAQPLQHQLNLPLGTGRDFVHTINRVHDRSEWMLAAVNPRTWTKKPEKALIFHTLDEVHECIAQFFAIREIDQVYPGRLHVGG